MKQILAIIVVVLSAAQKARGQEFYTPFIHGLMYSPVQGEDPHLFNGNPATTSTVGYKVGGYGLRNFRETKFTDNDDTKTVTTSKVKEDVYGAGFLADLGAGTAAGINIDRAFTTSRTTNSNSNSNPVEHMLQQSLMFRVQVELAPGLRIGLALRYVSLSGDILGSLNANNDRNRVTYHGSTVGNGGGIYYTTGDFRLGASYFPSSKGKSEILSEERIVVDPGMALIDVGYKSGPTSVGIGLQRWIHKRDERAVDVSSLDNQRTIHLDGVDWEKHVFPVSAYHFGVEWAFQQNLMLRGVAVRKDSVFVMDHTSAPTTTQGRDSVGELDYHLCLRFVEARYDILGGLVSWSRSKTLSKDSGKSAATYEAHGQTMYVTVGGKL